VDVVVRGRHCEVTDRFRTHVESKLSKLERFSAKIIRIDVEVSKERNPRLADRSERVELTVLSRGPVIRAEAAADDRHAALDLAMDKLQARFRKMADRRRIHRGNRTPISVAEATAVPMWPLVESMAVSGNGAAPPEPSPVDAETAALIAVEGDGPLIVREKLHQAEPMALDQALYEMELVGHDFYLFIDADSKRPSVVYRRRGYDYGVIRLTD
jgi:ribosomal subunit interface protein